nr:MAG TPA: hypothetical protein [Caudoviricetes sp.]
MMCLLMMYRLELINQVYLHKLLKITYLYQIKVLL